MKIYKLTPSLHANIWGGNKLRSYGKNSSEDRIGESWELSFVPEAESKIENGKSLSEAIPREHWGKRAAKFDFFPVLTKFIDAKDKLSVQVHPDDEYALKNEGQYGKSEMWYVVDADEGAGLYMGTKRAVDAKEFADSVGDGSVEELLSFKEVRPGDVFFIPAGTIHAIGGGVLIFEIQQNSTLTYRLYDYMRRDKNGNLRELHVEKAMSVLKAEVYEPMNFTVSDGSLEHGDKIIGSCEYFTTKEFKCAEDTVITVSDESFVALTAVRGGGCIKYVDGENTVSLDFNAGDTYFAPASSTDYKLNVSGDVTFITVEV